MKNNGRETTSHHNLLTDCLGNSQFSKWGFLDIETTGINPQQDYILDLALVLIDRQAGIEQIYSCLTPHCLPSVQGELAPIISTLTGIVLSEKHQVDPHWKERLLELLRQCGAIVAHNASFEQSFLEQLFPGESFHYIDTLTLSMHHWPGRTSYGLQALTRALGGPFFEQHRALEDVADMLGVALALNLLSWSTEFRALLEQQLLSKDWYRGWNGEKSHHGMLSIDRSAPFTLSLEHYQQAVQKSPLLQEQLHLLLQIDWPSALTRTSAEQLLMKVAQSILKQVSGLIHQSWSIAQEPYWPSVLIKWLEQLSYWEQAPLALIASAAWFETHQEGVSVVGISAWRRTWWERAREQNFFQEFVFLQGFPYGVSTQVSAVFHWPLAWGYQQKERHYWLWLFDLWCYQQQSSAASSGVMFFSFEQYLTQAWWQQAVPHRCIFIDVQAQFKAQAFDQQVISSEQCWVLAALFKFLSVHVNQRAERSTLPWEPVARLAYRVTAMGKKLKPWEQRPVEWGQLMEEGDERELMLQELQTWEGVFATRSADSIEPLMGLLNDLGEAALHFWNLCAAHPSWILRQGSHQGDISVRLPYPQGTSGWQQQPGPHTVLGHFPDAQVAFHPNTILGRFFLPHGGTSYSGVQLNAPVSMERFELIPAGSACIFPSIPCTEDLPILFITAKDQLVQEQLGHPGVCLISTWIRATALERQSIRLVVWRDKGMAQERSQVEVSFFAAVGCWPLVYVESLADQYHSGPFQQFYFEQWSFDFQLQQEYWRMRLVPYLQLFSLLHAKQWIVHEISLKKYRKDRALIQRECWQQVCGPA